MKFLFLTEKGTILPLAYRVQQEGNEVQVWTRGLHFRRQYEGILKQLVVLAPAISQKPDICIVDSPALVSEAAQVEKMGIPVLGGGKLGAGLEQKVELAAKLCEQSGMLVGVPQNGMADLDTTILYCNGNPVRPFVWSMTQTRFLAGDLGPATPGESTILGNYASHSPKAVQQTHEHLFTLMREKKYTGWLTVNGTVDTDGKVYFRSFSAGLGTWIYPWLGLLNMDLGKVLADTARGQMTEFEAEAGAIAAGVAVSTPPYPQELDLELYRQIDGLPVGGPSLDDETVAWQDVRWDKDGEMLCAGTSGRIATVIETAKEWQDALDDAVEVAQSIEVASKQYRVDAGVQGKRLSQLKKRGFFSGGSDTWEL